MTELIERVARAVCKAFAMDYHGLCEIDANFEADKEWENWIPEAKAAIAAMQTDAAPVADSEDWRKAWREVAIISSYYEDVRLNEAVTELHSVFEAYAHPPIADRVSTSSPVADRETGNTSDKADIEAAVKSDTAPVSDKLVDAAKVWEDAYRAWDDAPINPDRIGDEDRAAAAVIADALAAKDAELAERDAEIARLREIVDRYAGHTSDCDIVTRGLWSDPIPCTCGFSDALAREVPIA